MIRKSRNYSYSDQIKTVYVATDVHRSILECRSAYHEMSNREFSNWYERRYKVPASTVMKVIE